MNCLKNEKGAAMAVTLMVILVLTLLGTALWHVSMNEVLHTSIDVDRKMAFHLASSGAEAVKGAWLDAGFGDRPLGEVDRVYLTKDGDFVLSDPGQAQTVGYFDGIVEENEEEGSEGLIHITVTGSVGKATHSVTLTTFPYIFGHDVDPPLYNEETGRILEGPNDVNRTINGNNVTVKAHDPLEAAVYFYTEDADYFDLARDSYVEVEGLATVFWNPVNMFYNRQDSEGALVVSAEHIVFEGGLLLQEVDFPGSGSLSPLYQYNTVILRRPDESEEEYGVVHFPDDAEICNSYGNFWIFFWYNDNQSLAMAGKTYRFYEDLDLIKWHNGDYVAGTHYEEITGDAIPPTPQSSEHFFWEGS